MVHSFRDALALFPSLVDLAEVIAKGIGADPDTVYSRVRQWKRRDYIPPEYWPAIIKTARKLGHKLTADDLMRCASRRAAA